MLSRLQACTLLGALLLGSLFLIGAADCSASVTLSISPSSQKSSVGSQFSFDVNVSGLGNGIALGTYDIAVTFDPTVIGFSAAIFGSQLNLSGLGDVQSVTTGVGTVELFELSLDSVTILGANQASSFKLVTLKFNAVAISAGSTLKMAANAAGDASGKSLAVALQNGTVSVAAAPVPPPSITLRGVVPVFSSSSTIEPDSWVSIYGSNLASTTTVWDGSFPTLLGGTSVTINSKPAYLWFVSPTQINLQAPDDPATGTVVVTVTTPAGTASSPVALGSYAPSFSLLNSKYPAAIVLTPGMPGNSGAGYDLIGPTGAFSFATRPVKSGETLILYGVGFGGTSPVVSAGQPFSGAAPCTTLPQVTIGGVQASVSFAGIVEAGLFQLNVIVPSTVSGDQTLAASVGGVTTQENVFITLQ